MIQQSRVHYIYNEKGDEPTAQFWPTENGLWFAGPDEDEPSYSFFLTWDDLLTLCEHHPKWAPPQATPAE